jgi:hypothetical protein
MGKGRRQLDRVSVGSTIYSSWAACGVMGCVVCVQGAIRGLAADMCGWEYAGAIGIWGDEVFGMCARRKTRAG